jgi:hypothetical protein
VTLGAFIIPQVFIFLILESASRSLQLRAYCGEASPVHGGRCEIWLA